MTFAILIELPSNIKKELLRVCLGLPSAEWQTEENLFIALHIFGKLTDIERWDLMDRLGEVDAAAFSLKIHRLNYTPKRGSVGFLWAELAASEALDYLKKTVESQIRTLNQTNHENNNLHYQAIRLGTTQKESPERMAQYFEANGNFQSSIFEVREFILAQLNQTNKRSFYTVEKRYSLDG